MASKAPTTRVLVVDDDEALRKLCVAVLQRRGHDAHAVPDALSAMREVRANPYDILLTDIRMPGISGETLIDRVRDVHPDMMPIIMTGYPTMQLATSAPARGVYHFLIKPFQPAELLDAVQGAVNRRDQALYRTRRQFAAALLEMERHLGRDFDLPAAIGDVLGEVPTEARETPLAPPPAPVAADRAPSAPAPVAAPEPEAEPAGATADPVSARRIGDLAHVSAPLSAEMSATAADRPAFDTDKPLLVVLCEPIPKERSVLREAPEYRHFRTIYAAHRVLSQQLEEGDTGLEIKLVMAAHNADISSYLKRHARQICCVIFGPNMGRLTEGGLRITANGGRRRQVVACHSEKRMAFTWEHLRELGRTLDVWGCRAEAPLAEIREFWTRFFSEALMGVIQAEAGLVAGGAKADGGPLSREAIEAALARDEAAVEQLPGFPHICRQAIEAIDAGKRFPDVASIIEPDGSLQASLVRAANVARFGSRERIRNLDHALSRLGMESTRKIVMGESLRQLTQRVQLAGFNTIAFFHHSVSAGFYAQILALQMNSNAAREREVLQSLSLPRHAVRALKGTGIWRRFRLHDAFDPFTAGILHDVGKLVNVICYADAYPLILHQYEQAAFEEELLAGEEAVVGDFQHPVSGGALLDRWGVFKRLVDPIRDHHRVQPGSSPGAVLLSLANCMAKAAHPFPRRIAIPEAFRLHHLDASAASGVQSNPLPKAWARLEKPFREATQGLDVAGDSEEEVSAATGETAERAAREAANQSAPSEAYMHALALQNPEIDATLAWLEIKPRDLLQLQLILQPVVTQRVESLCAGE